MLNITCLLWGDDPSQGFMVTVSPKDTIYNLKQKIVDYLDYGNNISRRMKIIKLKEFITLDDERLKKSTDPKELFNSEELDKPFQILDDHFSSKDDNLKEFPLDIIVVINKDNNIPVAILDKKEKETEIMAPRKPIGTIVRESTIVTNTPKIYNKQDIDPSSFPSPPSFVSDEVKQRDIYTNKNNTQSNINNFDMISEIAPRTKSLIFNIDRFPSPPDDNDNNIITVNNTSNNNNSSGSGMSSKDKYVVYDIDQFPDAPVSEDFSITSKMPLTTSTEDAPPSYDAISISNKNLPSSSNNNNNIYNSNINNSPSQIPNQYEIIKKDKKSITIRKSVLITGCLCIGVMISTFLAVIIGKLLLDKGREGPQQMKRVSYVVGKIKSINTKQGKTTSTLLFATTTVNRPFPTYVISSNEVKDKGNKEITSKVFFKDPDNTEVSWKINEMDDLAMSVEVKDVIMKNTSRNKKRDYYFDYKRSKFNEYILDNSNSGNSNDDNDNSSINNSNNNSINTNNNDTNNKNNNSDNKSDNKSNNKKEEDHSNNYNPMAKPYFNPWNNFNYSNFNFNNKDNPFNKKDDSNNGNNSFYTPPVAPIMPYPGQFENESGVPKGSGPKPEQQITFDEIVDNDDFSMKLNLQVKRIMELPYNETKYENFIDLTRENEYDKSTVVDTSKNVSGGILEIKRVFKQINPETKKPDKEIEVYQKLYTCSSKCTMKQKDEFNLEVDPTKYRLTIIIKKWNFLPNRDTRLQIELNINSTKMYWSDFNNNVIHFDKGQITMRYGEKGVLSEKNVSNDKKIINEYDMFLVNGTDIYTDNPYSTIVMDLFGKYSKDENNNLREDHCIRTMLGINAEMTSYKILKSITSSALSRIKINYYFIWFFTIFSIVLHYFII